MKATPQKNIKTILLKSIIGLFVAFLGLLLICAAVFSTQLGAIVVFGGIVLMVAGLLIMNSPQAWKNLVEGFFYG